MFWSSSAFKLDDLPDLQGNVFLITGGTSGLGLSSAVALASRNATVVITARNETKGDIALAEIKKKCPEGAANVSYGVCDYGDLKSVVSLSKWFLAKNIPLHCLMLNAGIAMVPFSYIDEIESHFYVNHLSQHLLATLLLDKLKATQPSRIVFISSLAHTTVKETPIWKDAAVVTYDSFGSTFHQYGISKLANIQCANHLAMQLKDTQVRVNSVHPGAVSTGLASKIPFASTFVGRGLVSVLNTLVLKSADSGALTQVYVSAHSDIVEKDYRAQYFVPLAKLEPATAIALDASSGAQLWELSEQLIAKTLSK